MPPGVLRSHPVFRIGCAFGDDRTAALETGKRLADHDIADTEFRIEAAGNAREDDGIRCIRVDHELHASCHVRHSHAGGRDSEPCAVVGALGVGNGEALLRRGSGKLEEERGFLWQRADDSNRIHGQAFHRICTP